MEVRERARYVACELVSRRIKAVSPNNRQLKLAAPWKTRWWHLRGAASFSRGFHIWKKPRFLIASLSKFTHLMQFCDPYE